MARFSADPEALALGEALASLRRAAGLSQAEAGARLGMTSQGWGLYESGRRPGLFRPDVQRRLTGALEATLEDLALAAIQPKESAPPLSGRGVESPARAFMPAADAGRSAVRRSLQVSNDDLAPWASSGVVLEFDPDRWPRRDQGCVIDLKDGRRLVRIYEGGDADQVLVRGGSGGLTLTEAIARTDILSIAAVVARLDQ